MSYSIDVLKKSAFHHEIMSVLNLIPISERDSNWVVVMEYFETRMKDLDIATKR